TMLIALLLLTILQLVHGSCPEGFELVRNGQCRGFYTNITDYNAKVPKTAIEKCDDIHAQIVTIHDEEQQTYWHTQAMLINRPNYLVLGLVCNDDTNRIEWADGSKVDYKPPGYYKGLDTDCVGPEAKALTWTLKQNGHWDATDGTVWNFYPLETAEIFCTTQLQQPSGDGCESFEDDGEDEVCYQIVTSAVNWEDAQMTCHNVGADLASIHNQKENSFVRRLAVSQGALNGLYLGGTISGKGKDFGWIDGSDWDYDNFHPGFPVDGLGECLTMDTLNTAGQWMNVACSSQFPVACARPREEVPACTSGPFKEGQIIYSPGYPYDASLPCDYFLSVEAGKRIAVQVMHLEANSCCDFLILTDNYIGGNTIANLTGEITDKTYISNSNFMRVTWEPNGGVNVRGM
ncbi:hypothetical protein PENTCL1PPCAC_19428, partial [Pristionchus entomophagus]